MKSSRSGPLSLKPSDAIVLTTTIHLSIGIVTHALWLLEANQFIFRYYFAYEDPVFLLILSVLEFYYAVTAWNQFLPGQSLRWAWLFIMIAASCHLVGSILGQILSMDSYINPIYALSPSWEIAARSAFLPLGSLIGGPVQLFALTGGLFLALRLCRKLEVGKQRAIDWAILAVVSAYTLRVVYVVIRARVGAPAAPRVVEVMNWGNDPLLCVLLYLAFFLRRSVSEMGWGYVAKCWNAYAVAVLGTSIASMVMWATSFGVLPYPENAFIWYIWPIIFAAYALGPAYQVEAIYLAKARLADSTLAVAREAS